MFIIMYIFDTFIPNIYIITVIIPSIHKAKHILLFVSFGYTFLFITPDVPRYPIKIIKYITHSSIIISPSPRWLNALPNKISVIILSLT